MVGLGFGAALVSMGCSLDSLLNSDKLPPDVNDPAVTQTSQGAVEAYYGTISQFRIAFGGGAGGNGVVPRSFVAQSGLLTDELRMASSANLDATDRRNLVEAPLTSTAGSSDANYSNLSKVRGQATQAVGLLTHYAPEDPTRVAHLYALQGYTELFLAEMYCSGIPLSTLDYKGDYTYRSGSSTEEVFTHAVALFDTALVLAGDSTRFVYLARVGRARALVGLGAYAEAAAAAAAVPDGYRYDVGYAAAGATGDSVNTRNFAYIGSGSWPVTVQDHEGGNGLDWRTSGDPRILLTQRGSLSGTNIYHPTAYGIDGAGSILLASAVEARLIQAEAALQAGSPMWLTILNALRTDGTFDVTATSPPDTLWHSGSGGVAGLRPLDDPGTAEGRVDLIFRERGFWLFLTGHRQGDVRRLIRQYGRLQEQVYPIGPYGNTIFNYGSDITVPLPVEERLSNPLYTGCISRGA